MNLCCPFFSRRSECRRRERLERDHENELKAKAEELVSIQNKIFSMERDYRRLQGRFDDEEHFHNQQLKQLEKDLSKKQVSDNSFCWHLFSEGTTELKSK